MVLRTYGVVLGTNGVEFGTNVVVRRTDDVVPSIGVGLFMLRCHSKSVDWPCAVSSATAF